MKRTIACILIGLLFFTFWGCSAEQERTLTGLIFNRGHDSAWGNQLYMELSPTQIQVVHFIPQTSTELMFAEQIPITADQWQEIQAVLEAMTLKEAPQTLRERLFGDRKLDGGAYRELTLLW